VDNSDLEPSPPRCRPPWVPADLAFDQLDPGLQTAIREFFDPMYERLVLQAATPMERSAGLSCVQVLWLELIGQQGLGKEMAPTLTGRGSMQDHRESILQHVRLILAKNRVGKFLMEVQRYNAWAADKDPFQFPPL